ncbi:MAG TPA: pilus assembly protein TadG-related protein [Nocardioides sp.]|nr:pilus assembly protein TadG-related protein [Nocardioides sp.]
MLRRRRDERGVSAIFICVLMVVLLTSAAFSVDLGMQRVVRRDMQAVSDVVALDLARQLDGRTKAALMSSGDMQAALTKSVARNTSSIGDAPDVSFELGTLDASGAFTAIGNTDVPTVVRVSSKGSVGFAFGGITGVGSGSATRRAVAQVEESACIRVGSFIASVNSADGALLNPLLNGLLGSNLNLTAVGYQGLLTSNVSLADLVDVGGLGVGSVSELLALKNVSVADLFLASANALTKQGKLAEANILKSINVAATTPEINISDLIAAGPSDTAALAATLNVLDLVTGAAFIANDGHFVNIPNLGLNLSPAVVTTTKLTVIEAPRQTCIKSGKDAETAQVRLELTATIPAKSINVSILGLANVGVSLDTTTVNVSINLGEAIARVTALHCNASAPDSLTVALESSLAGAISVSASLGAHATFSVPLTGSGGLLSQVLSLLGLGSLLNPPDIKLDTALTATASAPPTGNFSKTVTVPIPGGYTTPVGSGSGIILSPASANVSGTTQMVINYGLFGNQTKTVLNADPLYSTVLNPILSGVASSLSPLLTNIQQALITPLSDLLGLQVAGANVFAVPTPVCNGVRLVG